MHIGHTACGLLYTQSVYIQKVPGEAANPEMPRQPLKMTSFHFSPSALTCLEL